MMKYFKKITVLTLLVAVLLSPVFTFAESIEGNIEEGWFPSRNIERPAELSCRVKGENRMINATTNEVTYRIEYDSPSMKENVRGTIHIEDDNGILLNKDFGTKLWVGYNHVAPIDGSEGNKIQFNTRLNSELAIAARLDGVNCTPKVFTAIKTQVFRNYTYALPLIDTSSDRFQVDGTKVQVPQQIDQQEQPSTSSEPSVSPDRFQLNGDILVNPDLSGALQNQDQDDLSDIRDNQVPGECRVVAMGARNPNGSLDITASIVYKGFLPEEYPYEFVGFQESMPRDSRRYDGDVQIASQNEAILRDGDRQEFTFNFVPKDAQDQYTINAHIGNAVCASVVFPAALISANVQDNDQNANQGVVVGGQQGDKAAQGNNVVIPVGADEKEVASMFASVKEASADEEKSEATATQFDTDLKLEEENDGPSPLLLGLLALVVVGAITGIALRMKNSV